MRVKKYALGGTATSYPVYNGMPLVDLPEATVFDRSFFQPSPYINSEQANLWEKMFGGDSYEPDYEYEARRDKELEKARQYYMADKNEKAAIDMYDSLIEGGGNIKGVSPIKFVHPVGDIEALIDAGILASEGEYGAAALAGGLGLASVFLPGTLQTKSTMAGGVLERSLDKNGRIHPNAIKAIIDSPQTSPSEKHILSKALNDSMEDGVALGTFDEATGRINYREFKDAIEAYVPQFEAKPSGNFSDYGVEKVFDENRVLTEGSYPDRVATYNNAFQQLYSGDLIPSQYHRELSEYFDQNQDWFAGLDLGDTYPDGYNRSTADYDRTRLRDFFDALLNNDVESLGLPPIDIDPNAGDGFYRPNFEQARDLFGDDYFLNTEMIGLFPDRALTPSDTPVPVSGSHLDEPGFGHFRTVYDPKEPSVAHLIELQSDAATNKSAVMDSMQPPQTYLYKGGSSFGTDIDLDGYGFTINPKQELEEAFSISNTGSPESYFDKKPRFSGDMVMSSVDSLKPTYDAINPKTGGALRPGEDIRTLSNIQGKISSGENLSIDDLADLSVLQSKERDILNGEIQDIKDRIAEVLEPKFEELVEQHPHLFKKGDIKGMANQEARGFIQGDYDGSDLNIDQQEIINDLVVKANARTRLRDEAQLQVERLQKMYTLFDAEFYNAISEDLFNLSQFELDFFDKKLNNPVRKGLIKNYTERILQESVSDIVSRNPGIKTIRIPAGDTAAKIQGHGSVGGSTKKYQSMDKTIKRVFGKKPGKVTDSRGNQWWEFDLPEGGFEKQIFKRGGKINVVKKRSGKYRVKKS